MKRHTLTFGAVSLLAALASAVPLTTARTVAAAEDDAVIEMARQRFQEGVRYFDQKQYDKARVAFMQAYALKRHPAVLLNLAMSELKSNREAEAAEHFAAFLREHATATEQERLIAEDGLAASKAKILEITVAVDEPGADIFVDGQQRGRSPLIGPLYLAPGPHRVEAHKDDKVASVDVTGQAGASTVARLVLGAAPPASPPRTEPDSSGTFQVGTGSDAVPLPRSDASPGRPGFFGWYGQSAIPWIGTGLAVAGGALGTVFALNARSSYDRANQLAGIIENEVLNDPGIESTQGICVDPMSLPTTDKRRDSYAQVCGQYQDNVDTGDTMKTAATASFIAGGVAAVGTVVLYFLTAESSETAATGPVHVLAVSPVVGPNTQGILFSGRF
jgi:uncharacterized protein YifE (UPF0438 family)